MSVGLFGETVEKESGTELSGVYTKKILGPVYVPGERKPQTYELFNKGKAEALIAEIKAAQIPEPVKEFLIFAAYRHVVFNYGLIADYYAHASAEIQGLIEKSALVIIDFDKALEYGYTKLQLAIEKQAVEEKV